MWDVDWRLLRVIARRLAIAFDSSCGGCRGRCCAKAGRRVVVEGKRWSPPARSDEDSSKASSSSEVVSPTAAGAGRGRAWGLGKMSETVGRRIRSGDCLRRFAEAIQDTQDFLLCVSSSSS